MHENCWTLLSLTKCQLKISWDIYTSYTYKMTTIKEADDVKQEWGYIELNCLQVPRMIIKCKDQLFLKIGWYPSQQIIYATTE